MKAVSFRVSFPTRTFARWPDAALSATARAPPAGDPTAPAEPVAAVRASAAPAPHTHTHTTRRGGTVPAGFESCYQPGFRDLRAGANAKPAAAGRLKSRLIGPLSADWGGPCATTSR